MSPLHQNLLVFTTFLKNHHRNSDWIFALHRERQSTFRLYTGNVPVSSYLYLATFNNTDKTLDNLNQPAFGVIKKVIVRQVD